VTGKQSLGNSPPGRRASEVQHGDHLSHIRVTTVRTSAQGGLFKTLDCESLAGFRSLCRRAFALIAANRTTASGDGTFPLSAWAQAGKMSGRMSFLRFEPLI
jgi:hypothetical protein